MDVSGGVMGRKEVLADVEMMKGRNPPACGNFSSWSSHFQMMIE